MPLVHIEILLILILLALYHLLNRWKLRSRIPAECQAPPELPRLDPFFGLDLLWKSLNAREKHKILETNLKQHEKYGKTFQASCLGHTTIHTTHPENLKAIYGNRWKEWGTGRADAMEPFCGRGFVTRDGEEWREHRILFASTLTEAKTINLKLLDDVYKQYVQGLPASNHSIDLAPIFDGLFLDLSLQFLFGERPSALYLGDAPVDRSTFEEAFDTAQSWMGMRLLFGRSGRFASRFSLEWINSCTIVHSLVDHHIRKAIEIQATSMSEDRAASLLGNLVIQGTNPAEIRSQIVQGMLVTQDTTGIVLSNTVFLLSRAPGIWSRVREEVAGIGPVDGWRSEGLKNLKLVHNCLKESLRIYPLFGANSRIAVKDTILPVGGGRDGTAPIFVPIGTKVSTSFYTLHRDPAVFSGDVEKFHPDRWDNLSPGNYEYMAFSYGPRQCAGQQKAIGEASYILARMALQFEKIETRDDRPWIEDLKLVVKNGNGCKVQLV